MNNKKRPFIYAKKWGDFYILWVMDNKYMGSEICEFGNSWFFSPIIWGDEI